MELFIELLKGGLATLQDYLLAHLPFVVPAFFLAGALYALFPKDKILRYLGPGSPKYISYPMSVAAGLCLAVCSCTILPLFAGIRKSGAGPGPAIGFLYPAPATNILAIIYTSSLIGWDVALARIILSIIFAVFIGITMSAIFKEKTATTGADGASAGAFATINKDMCKSWMKETWFFVRTILPLLLIGVFIAGMLRVVIPSEFVAKYFGGTTLTATLGAVSL